MTSTTSGTARTVLAIVAALVAAVVLLSGCATGTQGHRATAQRGSQQRAAALTAQQSPVTARHTFDPYTKSGKLTVGIARHVSGSCWTTSLADPTASAFRCFAGNQILDPCFAAPGTTKGGTVACIADPWSKATVLTLTKRLPSSDYAAHRVWAFRRAGGTTCVAATGTVPEIAGKNLPYDCSDGTFAALTGAKAQHVRTVFAAARATTLRTATVRALWHS